MGYRRVSVSVCRADNEDESAHEDGEDGDDEDDKAASDKN